MYKKQKRSVILQQENGVFLIFKRLFYNHKQLITNYLWS